MTYATSMRTPLRLLIVGGIVLTFLMFGVGLALAQGQGGGGGGGNAGTGGAGMGTQDQLRTQDRTQDPTTHTGDEPLQTRDQLRTQDQINAPTGAGQMYGNGGYGQPTYVQMPMYNFAAPLGGGDQDRLRTQDRIQDPTTHTGDEPLQTRDQLRTQDRLYISDPTMLRLFIASTTASSNAAVSRFAAQVRATVQVRNQVQAATMAFLAAQNLVGQNGAPMAALAQGVNSSTQAMIQAETQIQNRNWFQRFFFGGDAQAATTIQSQLQQNTQRMTQLRQYLSTCGCDVQVQTMLQEQLQNMEQEQTRLQTLADQERSRWGLFSWRW